MGQGESRIEWRRSDDEHRAHNLRLLDANTLLCVAAHLGFEVWQVKAGTVFDNILITDNLDEALRVRSPSTHAPNALRVAGN